jgi:hypothetical protein
MSRWGFAQLLPEAAVVLAATQFLVWASESGNMSMLCRCDEMQLGGRVRKNINCSKKEIRRLAAMRAAEGRVLAVSR